MDQKRQPKGTETGGQFAPDINPESTVVLDEDQALASHETVLETGIMKPKQTVEDRKPDGGDLMSPSSPYKSQAARDAQASNYGGKSYWDYLDAAEVELSSKVGYEDVLTRSLSDALRGNEGE
jgi:hypothetical protein